MQPIKFGTDGWRAIIADDYTVENVRRVAYATALWIRQQGGTSAVVGHDCRFAGELFAQNTAQVLASQGIKVYLAKDFVSTPMVSLGVVKHRAFLGVVITASHNPPSYNGFKLKSQFGGPSIPRDIAAVEALIPDQAPNLALASLDALQAQGLLEYVDLETLYLNEVYAKFDMPSILNSGFVMAYDAMYGTGQRIMQRILPAIGPYSLHCEHNPSFYGQAPEPIHRNLLPFSEFIKAHPEVQLGLANDGDADRIGLYDDQGEFVDSHHILLLLIHYLHHYKGMKGKVVVTFSVTDKVRRLCEHYGLPIEVTKIGFKYIAEIMMHEIVLVGGEESGGIAAAGHIPERDGIWMGLIILEFMAKTGKSLRQLIQEIYDIVGSFHFDRVDLHLSNSLKEQVIAACRSGQIKAFGNYAVQRTEDLDGYKFYLSADEWVMIRPSGTEPVLRIYAQAPDAAAVQQILDATCTWIKAQ
jgi:phosphomannomutase